MNFIIDAGVFLLGALVWLAPLFFLMASHYASRRNPRYGMALFLFILLIIGLEWKFQFHWLTLLKALGVYIALGVVYFIAKWKTQVDLFFDSFKESVYKDWMNFQNKNQVASVSGPLELVMRDTPRGLVIRVRESARFYEVPTTQHVVEWFTPSFSDNKEIITNWFVFWLFCLTGDIFNIDFVSSLLNPFTAIGQKIADFKFRKLKV